MATADYAYPTLSPRKITNTAPGGHLPARLKGLFAPLLCSFVALIATPGQRACGSEPSNELAIGQLQSAATELDIQTNLPQDLNFKSKADIMRMRTQLGAQYPQLLVRQYEPSDSVFGSIEDGKPWWGMRGEAVWGRGKRSIEGPSEESRFILNPFLLVGANPYVLTMWKKNATTDQDMDRPDFPFTWLPKTLRWFPKESRAEAIYPVTEFTNQLEGWSDKIDKGKVAARFALVAYNARDFGFNWLWVSPSASKNIKNVRKPKSATKIDQMIHCGNSCGYPGGCNNMSPSIPDIDEIEFTDLPASAVILLWKSKPATVEQQPDMTFVINLQ
jgi:hypothetical protein